MSCTYSPKREIKREKSVSGLGTTVSLFFFFCFWSPCQVVSLGISALPEIRDVQYRKKTNMTGVINETLVLVRTRQLRSTRFMNKSVTTVGMVTSVGIVNILHTLVYTRAFCSNFSTCTRYCKVQFTHLWKIWWFIHRKFDVCTKDHRSTAFLF